MPPLKVLGLLGGAALRGRAELGEVLALAEAASARKPRRTALSAQQCPLSNAGALGGARG